MKIRAIPFGYKYESGQVVVDETTANIVKEIFNLYIHGKSMLNISSLLNNMHIEYRPGVVGWNKARIKRIIEDKRYLGYEDYPSIISEDLSVSANSIKSSKNNRTNIDKDNLIYRINAEVRCPCCGNIMKRIYEPRNKIPERWRCVKQGCHIIVPISDNDLLLETQNIINTMISNPDLIIIPDSENTISSTTQRTINEINHMLNSRDAKSDDLRSKMLEAVSLKYRDLNTSTYESQRLKDLFRSLNPFTEFPIELFNQTVSIISFDNNENVTVTLINGQIIRKEDKNGTQKDSSCDSTYNCRQRGCQEQIQTEAGRSLLPSVHTAGRANQQL